MKPNTVGAAGFGGGDPEPADHWTAALEHLDAAGRTLAAAKVDATPRPELTPDAAADVGRAAIGEAVAEVRVGRALSAFVPGAEPAESLGR